MNTGILWERASNRGGGNISTKNILLEIFRFSATYSRGGRYGPLERFSTPKWILHRLYWNQKCPESWTHSAVARIYNEHNSPRLWTWRMEPNGILTFDRQYHQPWMKSNSNFEPLWMIACSLFFKNGRKFEKGSLYLLWSWDSEWRYWKKRSPWSQTCEAARDSRFPTDSCILFL